MATAFFFFVFLHNNVFMTLVPAGGLLANMGGQDSLRQRQNTHSAIYLQEQKTHFLALIVFVFFFFFPALALLPKCKSLTLPIRHLLPGLPKNNFLYLIVALLSNFDRLELKG